MARSRGGAGGGKSGGRVAVPRRRSRAGVLALAVMIVLVLLALWLRAPAAPPPPTSAPATAPASAAASDPPPAPAAPEPQRLAFRVRSVHPHDPAAYTQGLVWDRGALYESAGLYERSSLRRVDPATGRVLRRIDLPPGYFAEGLALVPDRAGDRLIQLTWKEQVALVYRPESFEKTGELAYSGEGWGLCYDGRRLVMSDGSDRLTFRDPRTFAPVGEVSVRLRGQPLFDLNELECVDGAVWANVYQTDEIVRIDPKTGAVTGIVDASGLLTPDERAKAEVLNGIAWKPETRTFLVTGKLWPKLFEVELAP